jgi:hypothetical protein
LIRFADHQPDLSVRRGRPLDVLRAHLLFQIVHRAPAERENGPRRVLARCPDPTVKVRRRPRRALRRAS